MNILISGIHGFIGSNLVVALKAQHILYGLDIVSPQKDGVIQTFEWNELEQIPSVDVIIHLAGKAHDTKNQTDAQVYFDINTGLTQQHRTRPPAAGRDTSTGSVQVTQMGHPPRQFGRQAASGRSLIPALPAAGRLRRAGVSSVFEQKYIMEYLQHDKTERIIQAFLKVY